MSDSKNELTENLKRIGMDLTQEQLDEIFADEEKSRIFFTVVLFCLATAFAPKSPIFFPFICKV